MSLNIVQSFNRTILRFYFLYQYYFLIAENLYIPHQMCANGIIKLTQFSSNWWDIQLIALFAFFQEVFKMCQMNVAVYLMYWGAYNVANINHFLFCNIIISHKILAPSSDLLFFPTHHEYLWRTTSQIFMFYLYQRLSIIFYYNIIEYIVYVISSLCKSYI